MLPGADNHILATVHSGFTMDSIVLLLPKSHSKPFTWPPSD